MIGKRECVKCGSRIPHYIIVDGRKRSLSNRKMCLMCSPFTDGRCGRKTGVRLDDSKISKTMKNYSNWPDEWKREHQKNVAKKGRDRKAELVRLSGGKCVKCGYSGCLRAMTFHHREPEKKKFELDASSIRGKNWGTVLEEMQKCDLVCIRCHAEIEDDIENGCFA